MTDPENARWFASKVDWWLAVILAAAPVLPLAFTIALLAEGSSGAWAGVAGCAFFAAIYGGLVFPMRYGIAADELVIRHGLVRQRCRLSDIQEVRPTRNPLSSPALSLDRLYIDTGKGLLRSVMISPRDKDGFLALLAERSGLAREGDRLVRS